jgi:hypothetical protein
VDGGGGGRERGRERARADADLRVCLRVTVKRVMGGAGGGGGGGHAPLRLVMAGWFRDRRVGGRMRRNRADGRDGEGVYVKDGDQGIRRPSDPARHDSLFRLCLRRSDYREGTKAGHGAHREAATHQHPPLRSKLSPRALLPLPSCAHTAIPPTSGEAAEVVDCVINGDALFSTAL